MSDKDIIYDPDAVLQLAGIMGESIVDGPGIRFAVFCQGCPHHCEGCHNPETHPFEGGTPVRVGKLMELIEKDPLLKGVTFSGGEPMCQAPSFLELAKAVKAKGLDIVIFTGYRYEDLLEHTGGSCGMDSERDNARAGSDNAGNDGKEYLLKLVDKDAAGELLELTDVLVDGPFVLEERDLTLRFRGSRNQRLIDLNKTRENGEIVLLED